MKSSFVGRTVSLRLFGEEFTITAKILGLRREAGQYWYKIEYKSGDIELIPIDAVSGISGFKKKSGKKLKFRLVK